MNPVIRREWQALLMALTFLTAFPFPQVPYDPDTWEDLWARSNRYYPVAGYLVGGVVAAVVSLPLPHEVAAALGVAAWLGVTGMLHWDGWVDSADALLAPKPPEDRLRILKDVHVGAFGLGMGVAYGVLLAALLGVVSGWEIVAAAVLARCVVLVPMAYFPAARSDGTGFGVRTRRGAGAALGLACLLGLPVLLVSGGALAICLALAAAYGLARWAAGRLGGGLTGDVYGAVVVAAELAALLGFCVQ